jgi:hypothetical protein
MEIYYSIMNILDYYAKNDKYLESKMIYILNYLALKGNIQISDIADANDCGKCESWSELVQALSELFKSGDRI